jgi:uncharacterized protein YecT (DUF1311 family)
MVVARKTVRIAAAVVSVISAAQAGSAAAAEPNLDRYYSKTYTACMDQASGSTAPMRDCISGEYGLWDKALNTAYQSLTASRAPAAKIQLRDDERAWLKRTDHKCDHAGDQDEGGTLQQVEIDQCNLEERIKRTLYLRGLH